MLQLLCLAKYVFLNKLNQVKLIQDSVDKESGPAVFVDCRTDDPERF